MALRLSKASASLSKKSPTIEEVEVIHKLYLASKEVKMQKEAIINAYLASPNDDADMSGLGDGRRRMGEAAEYAIAGSGELHCAAYSAIRCSTIVRGQYTNECLLLCIRVQFLLWRAC